MAYRGSSVTERDAEDVSIFESADLFRLTESFLRLRPGLLPVNPKRALTCSKRMIAIAVIFSGPLFLPKLSPGGPGQPGCTGHFRDGSGSSPGRQKPKNYGYFAVLADEERISISPLVIDAPLDDSVAGVPDRDSGN